MKYLFILSLALLNYHPAFAEDTVPTDSHILGFMVTANKGEIREAKLARSTTKNADVKEFAKQMQNEHDQNLDTAKTLANQQNIDVSIPDSGRSLKYDNSSKISELKGKKGADFDKAYVNAQIEAHKGLLKQLDDKFIPNAQNAALKTYLQDTRKAVQAHLDHAEQLIKSL